jgi:dTDP-4-dehydrorhamnose reductase
MPASARILVLGASGMLGSAVSQRLSACRQWRVDETQNGDPNRPDYMDILETESERWLGVLRRGYDYVVNCIGILKPAISNEPASLIRAIRVNALFPHEIADAAPGSRIIHMSTDGVFSENPERPRMETDVLDCTDVYGRTKALGECPAGNVLNVRCSIIGRDPLGGKGLVEWILRSPEAAVLTGFDNHLWNGVTTRQFAELCCRLIQSNSFEQLRRESGVYHFCPNPVITKYDLLRHIRDAAGSGTVIERGRSSTAVTRVLGSAYPGLRGIYADAPDWRSTIQDAVGTAALYQ